MHVWYAICSLRNSLVLRRLLWWTLSSVLSLLWLLFPLVSVVWILRRSIFFRSRWRCCCCCSLLPLLTCFTRAASCRVCLGVGDGMDDQSLSETKHMLHSMACKSSVIFFLFRNRITKNKRYSAAFFTGCSFFYSMSISWRLVSAACSSSCWLANEKLVWALVDSNRMTLLSALFVSTT